MASLLDKIKRDIFGQLAPAGSQLINAMEQQSKERAQYSREFLEWARGKFGPFYFPIVEFEIRKNALLSNIPELAEEEAAAITYFAMLAEFPQPTSQELLFVPEWDENQSALALLSTETDKFEASGTLDVGNYVAGYELANPTTAYYFMRNANTLTNDNPEFDARFIEKRNAYLNQLKKLQRYIKKVRLYDGIEKTISEESRNYQSELASIQASEQAAAYRAAKAREMAQEESEEARIEAAKQLEKTDDEIAALEKREEELRLKILKLQNGMDPETPTGNGAASSSILPLAAAAAAAFFAFKG